jgi:hypothetical protein
MRARPGRTERERRARAGASHGVATVCIESRWRPFRFGIVLIVAILFDQELYRIATAYWLLDLVLRDSSRPANMVVVLNVMPDRFYNERVAEYGVFAGHDGALNRIRLRMASPDNLARQHSVDRPH